jgi:predicted DNA-binding transcriptional regulator AlpA
MSNNAFLPQTGFVRLPSIIGPGGPIPVSKSTWWEGVRSGRYPRPVKLGPRITAWRVEDIRALIESSGRDRHWGTGSGRLER